MTEVIGVRFRGGCKEYYFDPHGITVEPNQFVIVETAQGLEYAQCVSGNHEVEDDSVVQPLRPLVRVATENDDRTYAYNKTREKNAFEVCQKKTAARWSTTVSARRMPSASASGRSPSAGWT